MTYSVHFRVDLAKVPGVARVEIQKTMEQIAEALGTVPASSPFWTSMRDSLLQIEVKRWRVVYRVDPTHEDIQIVELSPTRPPTRR
ncbi:MAG TPA: hypothetical protein VKB92_13475 [Myxococcales bacterium]|nr:hypothetical protein [Myxococcales bacterium]